MKAPVIGRAIEWVGDVRRDHVCTGTFREDLGGRRFRFNILTVQHDAPFPLHGHEYSELVVALEGSALHRTDLEDYPVTAGDVFVITPPLRHGFAEPKGLKICEIQFDPRSLFAGQGDLHRMMGYQALFEVEPRSRQHPSFRARLRLAPSRLAWATSLLRGIEEEFRGSAEGRETAIRGAFLQLAAQLCRFYAEDKAARPTPVSRMAQVLAWIRTHYRERIRVDDLARMACLSTSQFERAFRRAARETPTRMIARVRVEEACALLRDRERRVADVAEATGFGSPSFFSTQFRRLMGLSPREYRRRALGEAP